MTTHDPASGGEETFGPYIVYERLGVGGMATVHRAKEQGIEGFERIVALKRLLPHLAEDASFVKSFVREAKLASMLQHANIVQLYELGRVGPVYFISMEYIQGHDVRQILRQSRKITGPAPLSVLLSLLIQLCDALDYAHRRTDQNGEPLGLVHRDVSPSNLIVTESGHLKVIDFGIAKAQSQQLRTQTGRVKGKLAYMAPEALKGAELDRRSDIFSTGVIAHELLTARPLFATKNEYQTLMRVQRAEIEPPSALNPNCPGELDDIVLKALERNPDRRWNSAAEIRDALHGLRSQYRLSATNREVSAWLEWAFALEAPQTNTHPKYRAVSDSFAAVQSSRSSSYPKSGSDPFGAAMPSPIKDALDVEFEANKLEEEDYAWGENGNGPVILDDVPDFSGLAVAPSADAPGELGREQTYVPSLAGPSGSAWPTAARAVMLDDDDELDEPTSIRDRETDDFTPLPLPRPGTIDPIDEERAIDDEERAIDDEERALDEEERAPASIFDRPARFSPVSRGSERARRRSGPRPLTPAPTGAGPATPPPTGESQARGKSARSMPRPGSSGPMPRPGSSGPIPRRAGSSAGPTTPPPTGAGPATPPPIGAGLAAAKVAKARRSRASSSFGAGIVKHNKSRALLYAIIAVIVIGGAIAAYLLTRGGDEAASPTEPEATLKFEIEPDDATIQIGDRAPQTGSPYRTKVAPGTYAIQISREGYRSWVSQIAIEEHEIQTIRVALQAGGSDRASVRVQSTPPGFAVTLDGTQVEGVTPVSLEVDPGLHILVIRDGDREVWRHEFTAAASTHYQFHPANPALSGSRGSEEPSASRDDRRRRRRTGSGDSDEDPGETVVEFPVGQAAPSGASAANTAMSPRVGGVSDTGSALDGFAPKVPPMPTAPEPKATESAAPITIPPTAAKKRSGTLPIIRARGELPERVSAKLCIDTSGAVTSAAVLSDMPDDVKRELGDALRQWRYAPHRQAGAPVAACFAINFQIDVRR